jgi:uncharacterized membrane protein YdbT with pleckstrin-like domain
MDQDPTPPIPPNLPPQPEKPASDNQTPQPVAYDSKGRPLYAAPPTTTPQVVHMSRAVSPEKPEITPEVKARHEDSMRRYPQLNLSGEEFVISAVRRHPIGLVLPVGLTIFCVALVLSLVINYPLIVESSGILNAPSYGSILFSGGLLVLLFLIGGYIAVWVYINNRFFLTNESVIQEIQTSLFSKHEQTVSLSNIEDASYRQQGFLQSLLDYGSIRLSTEGDETTYRFSYVSSPKQEIATLNNAVEAFKNGRPVVND